MEEQLLRKIEAQNEKIDAIWNSVEKTRKYFLWSLWITIILFVLPLIGLIIVIPMFLNAYLGAFDMSAGNTEKTMETVKTLQSFL